MVLEYGCLVLVAILSARRPQKTLADLPVPPVVLKMSGVKDASPTSLFPLLIQAPFDSFMMGRTGRDEKPLVGWCVWVS